MLNILKKVKPNKWKEQILEKNKTSSDLSKSFLPVLLVLNKCMQEMLNNSEDVLLKAHTLISDRSGSSTHISFPPASTLVQLPVTFAGIPTTRTKRSASTLIIEHFPPTFEEMHTHTPPSPRFIRIQRFPVSAQVDSSSCGRVARLWRIVQGAQTRGCGAHRPVSGYNSNNRAFSPCNFMGFFCTAKMAQNACNLYADIRDVVQKSVKYYLGYDVGLVGARRHLWWESTTKQPKMRRRDFETRECITTMKAPIFFFK